MGRPRSPLCGFGINDADYVIEHRVNGKGVRCPFYRTWSLMINRTYSGRPAYKNVSVCEEWRYFMVFKAWMITQEWKGNALDKDIIKPGNKVYSPEYCCFVSTGINNLLTDRANYRGEYAMGVCREEKNGGYIAQCGVNGGLTYLGNYSTEEEASAVYRNFKARHIISIALTQENRVFKGLLRHAARFLNDEVK